MRLSIAHRCETLHEYARIYHALAAREDGSERKLILLGLAEDAQRRAERVEMSLRKFRGAHIRSAGIWCRRVIRWFLVRWRISWTLAILDRMESRRSRAMLEALMRLRQLCRVIAAAKVRPTRFSTRLSSRNPDDP